VLVVSFGLTLRIVPAVAKQPLANFVLRTAYSPFFAIRNWAQELFSLRVENAQLRQALAEATWRWQQHEQFAREAERLRVLMDLPPFRDYRAHVGEIVGWDRRGGREEVIVDVGRAGSVVMYTPVVTEDGVAGKVTELLEHFARVQLLIDPACRVAVRDARSGILGVARTGSDGRMYMEHVAVEADVQVGDSIVTTGIGGMFPEGLAVGSVAAVSSGNQPLLLEVEIEPAAHFDRLDYLFFLERTFTLPPGAPYDAQEPAP
jgi:rod shape-determining protein MreC